MTKMVHFSEFFKTWSLRSNSVTRQVSFNRTKIGGKCQNSKNLNTTFWVIFFFTKESFEEAGKATTNILTFKPGVYMLHTLCIHYIYRRTVASTIPVDDAKWDLLLLPTLLALVHFETFFGSKLIKLLNSAWVAKVH